MSNTQQSLFVIFQGRLRPWKLVLKRLSKSAIFFCVLHHLFHRWCRRLQKRQSLVYRLKLVLKVFRYSASVALFLANVRVTWLLDSIVRCLQKVDDFFAVKILGKDRQFDKSSFPGFSATNLCSRRC